MPMHVATSWFKINSPFPFCSLYQQCRRIRYNSSLKSFPDQGIRGYRTQVNINTILKLCILKYKQLSMQIFPNTCCCQFCKEPSKMVPILHRFFVSLLQRNLYWGRFRVSLPQVFFAVVLMLFCSTIMLQTSMASNVFISISI